MFSFITMNWRGRPLTTCRTTIELIAATTTEPGLTIRAERDTEWYARGIKISDTEMAALLLTRHDWHGDRNCTPSRPVAKQPCGQPTETGRSASRRPCSLAIRIV